MTTSQERLWQRFARRPELTPLDVSEPPQRPSTARQDGPSRGPLGPSSRARTPSASAVETAPPPTYSIEGLLAERTYEVRRQIQRMPLADHGPDGPAAKRKRRARVHPREGKGLPTWWAGSNPPHLGPGSYDVPDGAALSGQAWGAGASSAFLSRSRQGIDFRVVGEGGWNTAVRQKEHWEPRWHMSKQLDLHSQDGIVSLDPRNPRNEAPSGKSVHSSASTIGSDARSTTFKGSTRKLDTGLVREDIEAASVKSARFSTRDALRERASRPFDYSFGALTFEPSVPDPSLREGHSIEIEDSTGPPGLPVAD